MKRWLQVLAVVVVGLGVYANSMRNGFVWDDTDAIAENYFIRKASNLPHLFTRDYFVLSNELSYRPLVTLTYFSDYGLWGLKPAGYHMTNVVMHVVNALLLLWLVSLLSGVQALGFLAALLFVVHPAVTEAVNVVAFREDLMAGGFLLLGLLMYLNALRSQGVRRMAAYVGALLAFFLGLLSKEMAATLPGLILLYDLMAPAGPGGVLAEEASEVNAGDGAGAVRRPAPHRGEGGGSRTRGECRRRLVRRLPVYVAFLAVLGAYLSIRFVFMYNPKEQTAVMPDMALFETALTTVRILATYIKLMVLPLGLSAHYAFAPSRSPFDTDVVLSAALLGLCLWYAARAWNRKPLHAFAVLSFFVLLTPVMNIIPIVNMAAERYLYIPTAAFCVLAATVLPRRGGRVWVTAGLLVGLAWLTVERNGDWRDNETIWSETAKLHPDSPDIHHELGDVHYREGRRAEAIEEYKKALALKPAHLAVRMNLGVCYDEMGLQDLALEQYQTAARLNPGVSKVHNNIGNIYFKKGMLDEAVAAYHEAIRLNPYYPEPYNNMAVAYGRLGKLDEAIAATRKSLDIAPERSDSRLRLGGLYLTVGREAEGAGILRELIAEGHATTGARYTLAQHWLQTGRAAEAVAEYERILAETPQETPALLWLGEACEAAGDLGRAREAYEMFLGRWQGDAAMAERARAGLQRLNIEY